MYTREDYDKEPKISVIDKDSDSGLELLCYSDCTADDSDLIKSCRGIVFNGKDIVLNSFSFTSEYNEDDGEKLKNILGDDLSLHKFYVSHEGSILRIFYYNNKWFLSTHKKLDAYKSRWSNSQSFGDRFFRCLNKTPADFFKSLDKDKQYIYLLRYDEESRIVCKGENKLYFIGVYEKDKSFNMSGNDIEQLKFSSVDELITYVNNIDIMQTQGIICFLNSGIQIKILPKQYQEYFALRGNEQSVKFRYLQLRNEPEKIEKYRKLYPNSCSSFDLYDSILQKICIELEDIYVQRYEKKHYVLTSPEKHKILKKCYIMNIPVKQALDEESAVTINRLIRRK